MPKETAYSDVQKERRNVMAISIAMLLFMLATDGDFTKINKVSYLGSETLISNPYILFGFAWIYLFYAFWRFILYTDFSRKEFGALVDNDVIQSKIFKDYLGRMFPSEDPSKIVIANNKIKRSFRKRSAVIVVGNLPRELPLSYSLVIKQEIYCYIRRSFWNNVTHHLTDYLLPLFLFAFTILTGFYKYLWAKI